jgi:competence protein ComEC
MLEITVWDVSHGNAAYINTPNNRHIVVDLGDNGTEFSPLQILQARGVQQLDAVVITHPHRDHMDEIEDFYLLAPKVLWTPRHITDADIRNANRAGDLAVVNRYLDIRRYYTSPVTGTNDLCAPGHFGGAEFRVFTPSTCGVNNLNNHSLVVALSYAGLKVLIPGDNESLSWKELLGNPAFVAAVRGTDVLVAPHHGREAGYCGELFDAMGKPRLVVISDGRFGDTSATDRYTKQARGWTVFDANGQKRDRYCVKTRNDGHITIKIGWNNNDPSQGNYLNVTTSKADHYAWLAAMLGGQN